MTARLEADGHVTCTGAAGLGATSTDARWAALVDPGNSVFCVLPPDQTLAAVADRGDDRPLVRAVREASRR